MGMICSPKLCNKNIGHCAYLRAKDHHYGTCIKQQYCSRLFAWLSHFYVQNRMHSEIPRNHLKAKCGSFECVCLLKMYPYVDKSVKRERYKEHSTGYD